MSYLDAFLDEEASYVWGSSSEFRTEVVEMDSGEAIYNAGNSEVKHRMTVPFTNIARDVYAAIKRMQLVCRGRVHCFKFIDQLDSEAVDEVFGQGNGSKTVFQLRKVSTISSVSYIRNCYVIVKAEVTVGDTPTAVTIDMHRGLVTFAAPPADGAVLRWSGVFGVWVRFDHDDLPFTLVNIDTLAGAITLMEQRPPKITEVVLS